MKVTPKQYAESLFSSLQGKSKKEAQAILDKFVNVLIANNHVSQLDKILDSFITIWNRENKIVEAEIKTASKLDKDVIKMLQEYVSELAGVSDITTTETIDKDLLGGFVVKYEGKLVDNSLKTKVQALKNNLKQ
jgi:F-type H+-transporting ATPase subunit delta